MNKIALIFCLIPLISFSQSHKKIVSLTKLKPSIYSVSLYNQTNVLIFEGDENLLLVDTGYEQTAKRMKDFIQKQFKKNIRFIINTHWHYDHTGGNKIFGKKAIIIAHHEVKNILNKESSLNGKTHLAYPTYALPNITFSDSMVLNFNNEALRIFHMPNGHTSSDILIYFPTYNLLSVGDLLFANQFPFIDTENGGNLLVYVKTLQNILQRYPSNTLIAGGHGQIYTMIELENHLKTLKNSIQDIQKTIGQNHSIDEIEKNKLLEKYKKYGSGFVSTKQWIKTVHSCYESK